MKRSPLRRRSPKRRRLMESVHPVREEFLASQGFCWICGKRTVELDCHEISRGSSREASLGERAAWLACCRLCHDELDDPTVWPVTRQLAVKRISDTDYYDRPKVNGLRGRQPDAITEEEVVREERFLRSLGINGKPTRGRQ